MGRPKKEINLVLLKKLSAIHCTQQEMSDILDIHRDTFIERLKSDPEFSDIYKKARSEGKMSLRRYQFELAKSGHATMLIWLGKQYLGQTDKLITQEGFDTLKWTEEDV